MRYYRIDVTRPSPREEQASDTYIRARSIEHAAQAYANRLNRRHDVWRVTGEPGGSGTFQRYEHAGQSQWASVGRPFHVREA